MNHPSVVREDYLLPVLSRRARYYCLAEGAFPVLFGGYYVPYVGSW